MLAALAMRERLDINVVPDRNPLFVTLSDGSIRNGYTVKVINMEQEPRRFTLALEGLPGALMALAESTGAPSRTVAVDVEADKLKSVKVYVTAPRDRLLAGATEFSFVITAKDKQSETSRHKAIFHAPEN